jgi:endogenous inhibitor of DNA gyrase (YacG/DUF329 family)
MTTITTGRCAACGQPFTTAAHQRPQRRFCSERCRKNDWQRRHGPQRHRADVAARRGDVVPRPTDVVGRPVDVGGTADDIVAPPGASAARCPHCTHPIAVINLLVAPAAAQVPVPGASHA